MLNFLESVGEVVAALVILSAIAYTVIGGIAYLVYRRKHKDEDI